MPMPRATTRVLALTAGLIVATAAPAAPPGTPEYWTRAPVLSIPFSPNLPGSRVRDVELYASTDGGKTWTYVTQAPVSPRREDNKFRYTMPSDGTYAFAVRSIDAAGVANPPNVDQLQTALLAHLDRRAPLIQLRSAAAGRPSVVGVEWDVREEHFDANRFVLEYRVPGQSDWVAEPRAKGEPTGVQQWELTTAPKLEVRVKVTDKAGNEADATLLLTPGASGAASSAGDAANATAPSHAQPRPGVHFINTPQIAIPFRVSNVGVSGVPIMDLWVTRDNGRAWQKVPRSSDEPIGTMPATPGEGEALVKRFAYTAPGEGLYGFTVVVRSGVGIGDADPRPGDAPKRLVEVDTTRPDVQLTATRGAGADVRNVTIEWTARDKNLIDRPVTLLWSKAKDGPNWEPIVADLDAKGRYVWTITDQGPFQFYVQVRAVDKAGNTGTATGNELITVDLNRPKADLLDPVPLDRQKP
jgi:hypothetical protein